MQERTHFCVHSCGLVDIGIASIEEVRRALFARRFCASFRRLLLEVTTSGRAGWRRLRLLRGLGLGEVRNFIV